eukprot:g9355.t1
MAPPSEVPFQGVQQMVVGGIGETCRWDHPALQFPDGSVAFWPSEAPVQQVQQPEQLFVMVPADFPCQGAGPAGAAPFAGDHLVSCGPCACGACGSAPPMGGAGVGPSGPCMPCGGCFGSEEIPFCGDEVPQPDAAR